MVVFYSGECSPAVEEELQRYLSLYLLERRSNPGMLQPYEKLVNYACNRDKANYGKGCKDMVH